MGTSDKASGTLLLDHVGLLVLAAGASTRMGCPKALAPLAGLPLLEHVLAPALLRRFGAVVVVLGHHADAIRPIAERCRFRHVTNPDPDRGRTGSIQTGLAALGPEIRAAFVQPVDCPLILSRTYLELLDALGPADVAIPSHYGEHGHPPLVARAVFSRILAAAPDEPLRDIFQSPGIRRQFVEVHDSGVLMNVDRPEDLPVLEDLYASRRSPDGSRSDGA
jgi:molybdenum cofactor cytidylyltransferase